jgi:hypothetical protein
MDGTSMASPPGMPLPTTPVVSAKFGAALPGTLGSQFPYGYPGNVEMGIQRAPVFVEQTVTFLPQ